MTSLRTPKKKQRNSESSVASMITCPPLLDSYHRECKSAIYVIYVYRYRTGLTENDLEGYNEQVKAALSLTNASIGEITQARI